MPRDDGGPRRPRAGKGTTPSAPVPYRQRENGAAPAKVSWEDIDQKAIWRAIVAVTDYGDAILFSRSTDGGTYRVLVYHGEHRLPYSPHSVEDVHQVLEELIEDIEAAKQKE